MGTNFYRIRKISDSDKKLMHVLIDANKIFGGTEDYDSVENLLKHYKERIHLGKRSAGWKFLWNHNWKKYYDLTQDCLREFLAEPGTIIIDEYGKEYSANQFWHEIMEWDKAHRNTYRTKGMIADTMFAIDILSCEEKLGVSTYGFMDFESDGLRFSVHDNFC